LVALVITYFLQWTHRGYGLALVSWVLTGDDPHLVPQLCKCRSTRFQWQNCLRVVWATFKYQRFSNKTTWVKIVWPVSAELLRIQSPALITNQLQRNFNVFPVLFMILKLEDLKAAAVTTFF